MTITAAAEASPHDRIPPQSLEAESALLGALLVAPELLPLIATIVQPADFYAQLHNTIFASMLAVQARNVLIDKVSLCEELRQRGMLDNIGGPAYLGGLMESVTTVWSAEYYAKLVREKALGRELIRAGIDITRIGYESEPDIDAALAEAEAKLAGVRLHREPPSEIENPGDAIDRIIDDIRTGRRTDVLLTPWGELNRRVGGFTDGELVSIPAPPSIGKTALVITLTDFVAARVGAVLLGSFEMGKDAAIRRRLAQVADVSVRAQKFDMLASEQKQRLYQAAQQLRGRPLYIVGREHASLRMIWAAAREVVKKAGALKLIVVDQMGWIEDVNRDSGRSTRNDRKSHAYMELIRMAEKFGCPVVAIDHLNRDGMKERPSFATLGKIRDGGNVEGHAHHVIFPWRGDPINAPTAGELIIAKSRDGDVGAVPMHFDGARSLWTEAYEDGTPHQPWWEHRPRTESTRMDFTPEDDDGLGSPLSDAS